ncbi:MAG: 30S ribosomal protein S18 [Chloroherpetonaceae bacterium]|nr:30S ribosomal protein S18 [Chloroherpetonaceae bacterium]MDW8437816.1 30S ribosomal protein S18 [Chloroherpetonaceae bacterium]
MAEQKGNAKTKQSARAHQAKKRKAAQKNQVVFFDYRDDRKLRRFINEQGKIIPRRITGLSAKEQNLLTKSIKWARHLAIIPFVSEEIR